MKNFLSRTDLAIWVIMIVGKVVLCLCILKRDLVRRLPWVSGYVFISTTGSLLLLALIFLANYTAYYYTFYAASFAECAVAFVALLEFWRQVFPGFDLPHNKQALGWFLAALAGVAVFATLWPLRYFENRIEVAAYLAIGVTFMFIAGYARYLGLYWSRLVGGVSFTLGLHFLVDGIAKALMAHYRYHSPVFAFMRSLSEIVSIMAVMAWMIVILSPWGERQITEEELVKLEQLVDHMEADFIAAVRKGKFLTGGGK